MKPFCTFPKLFQIILLVLFIIVYNYKFQLAMELFPQHKAIIIDDYNEQQIRLHLLSKFGDLGLNNNKTSSFHPEANTTFLSRITQSIGKTLTKLYSPSDEERLDLPFYKRRQFLLSFIGNTLPSCSGIGLPSPHCSAPHSPPVRHLPE